MKKNLDNQQETPFQQPNKLGLYNSANEHDACGVGMLVNINGEKSHAIVQSALKVLENMKHRGAEGADNKTGDGAGIMLQIPHEFILLQGIPVPEKGTYGTGLLFLPKDKKAQQAVLQVVIEEIERERLTLMHLRNVPTNHEILGVDSGATEPDIKQIFVTGFDDSSIPDRLLYIIRKRIERRISEIELEGKEDFYIVSLSTKNIVYKGMLSSTQLREYYPDLSNKYFTSGLALVHSRFSTNTFPRWSLAQPFRLLAHNGEINTIQGNREWMSARVSILKNTALGDLKDISPIIEPGMSDSASLDNVLDFFVNSGMSLPHAMAMLVPESFNEKNPISDELKAFYEYHSILMEPWDGPAALLFSDGRYAGGMLDRNGLRPSRYLITKGDMIVIASEVGVEDFEPTEIKAKGRLQPGKLLVVDTEEGKIYYNGEIKEQLAEDKPTHVFLQAGVGSFAGAIQGYLSHLYKEERPITVICEPHGANCIYKSMEVNDGNPHNVTGDLKTIMAGLACGEPNTISWKILRDNSDFSVSCEDSISARGMRVLSSPLGEDKRVISGESGSVGLGLVTELLDNKEKYKEFLNELKLNENSKVLCISTEGDTDLQGYKNIVWDGMYSNK